LIITGTFLPGMFSAVALSNKWSLQRSFLCPSFSSLHSPPSSLVPTSPSPFQHSIAQRSYCEDGPDPSFNTPHWPFIRYSSFQWLYKWLPLTTPACLNILLASLLTHTPSFIPLLIFKLCWLHPPVQHCIYFPPLIHIHPCISFSLGHSPPSLTPHVPRLHSFQT
jgi:hypothetical protein